MIKGQNLSQKKKVQQGFGGGGEGEGAQPQDKGEKNLQWYKGSILGKRSKSPSLFLIEYSDMYLRLTLAVLTRINIRSILDTDAACNSKFRV